MLKRFVAGFALAAIGVTTLGASPAGANVLSAPISDGGVTPFIIAGANPGGNRTCAEAGAAFGATFDYDTSKVDFPGFVATSFEWTSVIGDVPTGQYVTVTVTDGKYVAFSSTTIKVGAAIVKGSNDANVYYYPLGVLADSGLASPLNASGDPAGLSNLTFCGFEGGPIDEETGQLTVRKFYDANANGVLDVGEATIEGWQIDINGTTETTTYSEVVDLGPYTVTESTPVEANWVHTTPTSFDVEVTVGNETVVEFGNLCLGGGGGKTLGFWSNKNGAAKFGADDLAEMVALNLRKAGGGHFDPAGYSAFRTWLLSANATNMAYMLSAQMAAMHLNVYNGLVDGTSLIYAPGTTSANALGFATVNSVLAEANASLGAFGNTTAAGPARTHQEALKNALDAANNNQNFVQATPCPFSF